MSSHSTGTESSNTNNEPSVSYRINSHVGVEFISTTTTTTQGPVDNHDNNQAGGGSDTTTNNNNNDNNPLTQVMQQIQPLDYAANGLQSISITNFTGRIVFHRMGVDVPDCPSISIYSESSISNSGGAHSEYSESHTGGSRAGSRAGSFVVEPTVAVVATTGVSRRDDDDESESKQHRPQLPETTPITSKGGGSGAGVLASIVQSLAHQGGGGGTTATVTPTNDNDDDDNNDHHNGGDWDDSAGGLSLNAALSVPSSYVPPPAPRSLGPPRSMAPSPLRVKTGNNDREDSINRQLPFRPPPEQPGAVTATKGHDDHSIVSSSQPTARTPSNAEASLNRLHKVLTANSKISRTIPDGLRTKRLEQRAVAQPSVARTTTTTTTETTLAASNTATTTPSLYLHFLCAQPTVTLDELHNGLNQSTNAIRTKDASGRLPLHILGDNETLITSDKGRNVATLFAGHLMNEYPHATTTADDDGFIPFARLIADWIDWANDQVKAKEEEQQQGEGEIEDLGDEGGGGGNNKNKNELDDNLDFYPGRPSSLFGSRKSTSAGAMTQHWHIGSYYKKIFPRVEVWEEVEWCFSMLSAELDLLGRNSTVPMFQRLRMNKPATEGALRHSATTYHLPSNDRKALVDALMVSMPNLLRTVLLIDDDGMDTRERILEMAICRRLLLCPQAVDQWLIDMINHGGIPARRAVDYLCLVSKTSVEDYTGGFGTIHSGDLDAFNEDRQKVFEAIGALKGTIASLVTLQNRETDRAAATAVIWHTMSQKLSRPFVLGLVLIDLLLHITLMVSFRSMVRPDSTLSAMEVDQELVVYLISVHYLLRKACEAWVLLTVSPTVLRAYFSNMWTMFDTIAIVFTVWATIWYDHSPDGTYNTGLNTLVVGLLWVKVLGFLKVVNKDMSTFIMALSQILYDIRFFMVVLVVCVIMFGDMFYIAVSTEEDTEFCSREQDSGTIEDFCDSSWSSYLRVYVSSALRCLYREGTDDPLVRSSMLQ